jgi:chorismate mutase
MNKNKRLYALRGATQSGNEEEDIIRQVSALYDELLVQNGLHEGDLVSLIFSVTPDITAKNPAAALRQAGRAADLALFVVQEAVIPGGLERTIRVLLHCYMEEGAVLQHIYRNGTESLRPDRAESRGGQGEGT